MDIKTAKQIPIAEYLASLGYEASSVRGADKWYLSPFRGERTPSFKVDSVRNLWYDHGEGVGGTIIDLAMRLNGGCDVSEAIRALATGSGNYSRVLVRSAAPSVTPVAKVPSAVIESVRPLADLLLVRYLERTRAIPMSLAEPYVREVRYRTANGDAYTAIGFQNASGGFELRNPRYKGSIGPKDVTVVGEPRNESVRIFEGFSDFLSALALWPDEREMPAVVLNSVSMSAKGAEFVRSRGCSAMCFFDSDLAGARALAAFRELLGPELVSDARVRLGGSKDVNEFLVKRRDERNLALRWRTPGGSRS